jgi:hypothetical protein
MNPDQNEIQKPTAADFMSDELEYDSGYGYYNDDLSDYNSDDYYSESDSDLDFDTSATQLPPLPSTSVDTSAQAAYTQKDYWFNTNAAGGAETVGEFSEEETADAI